jgi:hypothetical protein
MISRHRKHKTNVLYWACSFVPTCAIILSCLGFVVTRLQMFSEALNSEMQKRAQEKWLRNECARPDFYANLQLHADLCDKVEANARGNVWLTALAHLFENTYLCGYSPCAMLLDHLLDWIAAHGIPFLLIFAVVALLLPTVLVPLYRQYNTHAADEYVSHRYNPPFPDTRYFDNRITAYPLLKHD